MKRAPDDGAPGKAGSTYRRGRPVDFAIPRATPQQRKWRAQLASLASREDPEAFARERNYSAGWVSRVMAARRRKDWAL